MNRIIVYALDDADRRAVTVLTDDERPLVLAPDGRVLGRLDRDV